MSAFSPSSSSNTIAACSPTKWPRASTIPAIGPSKAPSPASSKIIFAPSSACPSAPQDSPAIPPCSISSANSPNPPKSSPSPTPTSTSTASPLAPAANSATSLSAPPPPNASPFASPNSPPSSTAPTSASTPPSLPPPPSAPELHYEQSNLSASVGVRICDKGILKTSIPDEHRILSDLQCGA